MSKGRFELHFRYLSAGELSDTREIIEANSMIHANRIGRAKGDRPGTISKKNCWFFPRDTERVKEETPTPPGKAKEE